MGVDVILTDKTQTWLEFRTQLQGEWTFPLLSLTIPQL